MYTYMYTYIYRVYKKKLNKPEIALEVAMYEVFH